MASDNDELSLRARQRRLLLQAIGCGAVAGGLTLSGQSMAQSSPRDDDPLSHDDDGDILDVAIIGAGLSGLTSARDLQLAGCEAFVVLEARDRVGGRVYDHDLGDGVISEAGGQWIGPGQTAIADLARELEIEAMAHYVASLTPEPDSDAN